MFCTHIKLKSLTYLTLTPCLACLRKKNKKKIRYIQTNDIFVDALSYSNSIVTDRLIFPRLVVENVLFAYPDRSPLSAIHRAYYYIALKVSS